MDFADDQPVAPGIQVIEAAGGNQDIWIDQGPLCPCEAHAFDELLDFGDRVSDTHTRRGVSRHEMMENVPGDLLHLVCGCIQACVNSICIGDKCLGIFYE